MKAIEIISIPVTDQQRAKAFYLNLGFELIVEAPFSKDAKWIQLGLPQSTISITLVTWLPNMSAGCINGKFAGVIDPNCNMLSLTEIKEPYVAKKSKLSYSGD